MVSNRSDENGNGHGRGVRTIRRAAARLRENTELATTVERDYPLPIEQPDGNSVVKIQLGMANFKTVGLSLGRQQVKAMRDAAQAAVEAAQKRLEAAKTKLARESDRFLKKEYQFPAAAVAAAKAVEAWTGGKVEIVLLNKGYSAYGYYREDKKEDREPELDPQTRVIRGKLVFYLRERNDSHPRCIDELCRSEFEAPLPPEICQLCDEMAEADAALKEALLDQRSVNAEAARVEERSDDLETTLTIRHLEGSLTDTRDILQVIREVMLNPAHMAERARKFVPALPPATPHSAGALPPGQS